MNVYIDIETVASQSPNALTEVRATLKPPGTLKKPESIANWWAEESDTAAQETWRKQALDGGLQGEIVSIAVCADAYGTDEEFNVPTGYLDSWVWCRRPGEETEAQLLQHFADHVHGLLNAAAATGPDGQIWPVGEPFPIAHNAAFDIGFIWRRCIVNDVRLPFRWPGPMARAGKDYACTMLTWAGYGNRVSLNALCKALGIASPKAEGMDGSQVLDRWLAGEVDTIADYNLRDAKAVREVWQRLQGKVTA